MNDAVEQVEAPAVTALIDAVRELIRTDGNGIELIIEHPKRTLLRKLRMLRRPRPASTLIFLKDDLQPPPHQLAVRVLNPTDDTDPVIIAVFGKRDNVSLHRNRTVWYAPPEYLAEKPYLSARNVRSSAHFAVDALNYLCFEVYPA